MDWHRAADVAMECEHKRQYWTSQLQCDFLYLWGYRFEIQRIVKLWMCSESIQFHLMANNLFLLDVQFRFFFFWFSLFLFCQLMSSAFRIELNIWNFMLQSTHLVVNELNDRQRRKKTFYRRQKNECIIINKKFKSIWMKELRVLIELMKIWNSFICKTMWNQSNNFDSFILVLRNCFFRCRWHFQWISIFGWFFFSVAVFQLLLSHLLYSLVFRYFGFLGTRVETNAYCLSSVRVCWKYIYVH